MSLLSDLEVSKFYNLFMFFNLVHSKEIIILQSNVVVGVVYPINHLDFDDELKGLFKKFDVCNIDYVNKCLKMHGCKTWTGSKRDAATESKKLNKRFKGYDLVRSKKVIILQYNVVVGVVYPINKLDFDDEEKGLFNKFDMRNIDYVNK
ncbi:unnamed protein product [Prunus brigantina]